MLRLKCAPGWIALAALSLLLAACQASPTPTPLPTCTPVPSGTPAPTCTAPPTPTVPPTLDVAPIQTAAAATVLARVAAEASATTAAIPTATATPLPTETPLPTQTATDTPRPKPSKTPTPAISLELTNMRYEQWGKPVHGCSGFDDRSMVRKFNLEMTITNHTKEAIREWYPDFYGAGGSLLVTCYYVYSAEGFPSVPPGESRTVTFASFCDLNDYVKEMKLKVLEKEYRRCFAPGGTIIACP